MHDFLASLSNSSATIAPCTDHGWEFIADTTCANIYFSFLKSYGSFYLFLFRFVLSRCQLYKYGLLEFALSLIFDFNMTLGI